MTPRTGAAQPAARPDGFTPGSGVDGAPAPAHRPRRLRAFTLIEMIAVIVLVGLVAGLVVSGVGRSGASSLQGAAISGVLGELALARVDAMAQQARRELRVSLLEEGVRSQVGERVRQWKCPGLVSRDREGAPRRELMATFDPSGRTRERAWSFEPAAPAAGDDAARIWAIRFDPVSGAPAIARGAPAVRAGEEKSP